MSTVTTQNEQLSTDPRPTFPSGHVSLRRVIAAEWVKFYSLRSNPIAYTAAILAVIGFGALAAGVANGDIVPESPTGGDSPDFTSMMDHAAVATSGVMLAILILGTVGVLAMSGEYSSGMVRATVAAVPKRLPVLWGKAIVLVAVTAVTMAVSVFVSFALSGALLGDAGIAASPSDSAVVRALLGNVGYTVGIVLLGLALGVLLRSTAGGVATLFATVLIVPQLLTLILPDKLGNAVYGYLPSNAALSFTSTDPHFAFGAQNKELLSAGVGAVVFAVWVLALLAAAAVTLRRRDA